MSANDRAEAAMLALHRLHKLEVEAESAMRRWAFVHWLTRRRYGGHQVAEAAQRVLAISREHSRIVNDYHQENL